MQDDGLGATGWLGVAIVLVLIAGAVVGIYPGYRAVGAFIGDQQAPAWVQAVGSVGAIAVAIYLGNQQTRRARADRLESEAQRFAELYAPVLALAEDAEQVLSTLYRKVFEESALPGLGAPRELWKESDRVQQQLSALDATRLPTVVSIRAARNAQNLVVEATERLQELGNRSLRVERRDPYLESKFLGLLDEIRGCISTLKSDLVHVSHPTGLPEAHAASSEEKSSG